MENMDISDCIQNVYEECDCIPSNLAITRAEFALSEMQDRGKKRISEVTKTFIAKYDFMIFDTNSMAGSLNKVF